MITVPYDSYSGYVPCCSRAKKGVVAAVLPLLLLTPGSGGILTLSGANTVENWIHSPVVGFERSLQEKVDTRSVAEHVSLIRDGYGLNVSELASVLRVSRPTVYAWLHGQQPKSESLPQILRLSGSVSEMTGIKGSRIQKLVRRPIFEGQSLLDKMRQGDDVSEGLIAVKTLAIKESSARLKKKGSGRNRLSMDQVSGGLSTPAYSRS